MRPENQRLADLLRNEQDNVLRGWAAEYQSAADGRGLSQNLAGDQQAILRGFERGLQADGAATGFATSPAWSALRDTLAQLSSARAAQGETADVTSAFVLSLKRPIFDALQRQAATGGLDSQIDAIWATSALVDRMAQWTVSTYTRTREDIITRQQHELLELSTPVIKLWEGVLAVPVIGTLDSSRAQMVLETLLDRLVETSSELAIIDITGVPTVDTLVAQHLMKTVTAIRLMGAECIISGIRPQIAQTIVHLGIDLQGIITKASLADALGAAMRMTGHTVVRNAS
ncbi:STAS domain-containing protein [Cupriavidus pauculus]|uniref:STAS domain-containing protein n=1 Tax=Cupriavidus pauculus TaxID=82633 RepID=UPI0012489C0A|nr:STAS domain-containing protein [Cupriavidus pauculus]KAB0605112.1 STAS domain-containing protein [Cupriavidus pauculus]MCM3605009.1 STAS domain-containing protein [Cupriavidus pauculus]UAK99468.1 STAS domain-containing protein [Cupriavidus pauculus]